MFSNLLCRSEFLHQRCNTLNCSYSEDSKYFYDRFVITIVDEIELQLSRELQYNILDRDIETCIILANNKTLVV